ncbi:gas vesicle protein [Archangium sp.]|uniref:gas vesicle protein n=1 Tax=Archangium sp. TaxID=1872627 RepID=UPI00389981FB
MTASNIVQSTRSATLADVLERVLDKGLVVAGDIKIKLLDIELLTIQVRLVVCSVDKAAEMGMDFWRSDPSLSSLARREPSRALPAPGSPGHDARTGTGQPEELARRVAELEAVVAKLEGR